MVENFDLLVATVVYVHVFLFPVGRKADPPRGAPIIWKAVFSLEPNVVFEFSHFIEDLDPVALSVTNIDQAVVADNHTMHNLHERATHTRVSLVFCALMPPLTKEFPRSIENSYAAIAITVSHVDVAIGGVYRYVGRHEKLRVTRIQCPALESAIGSIDNASLTDLHKQLSVVTVFLDDSIAIAGCPKIILIIDFAAVGDIRNDIPVAEAIHHISVGIEFDVRWRLLRDLRFFVCHVTPINDEHVILRVHTYAADLSDYPSSWQRLRPVGIDRVFRPPALRLNLTDDSEGDHEA